MAHEHSPAAGNEALAPKQAHELGGAVLHLVPTGDQAANGSANHELSWRERILNQDVVQKELRVELNAKADQKDVTTAWKEHAGFQDEKVYSWQAHQSTGKVGTGEVVPKIVSGDAWEESAAAVADVVSGSRKPDQKNEAVDQARVVRAEEDAASQVQQPLSKEDITTLNRTLRRRNQDLADELVPRSFKDSAKVHAEKQAAAVKAFKSEIRARLKADAELRAAQEEAAAQIAAAQQAKEASQSEAAEARTRAQAHREATLAKMEAVRAQKAERDGLIQKELFKAKMAHGAIALRRNPQLEKKLEQEARAKVDAELGIVPTQTISPVAQERRQRAEDRQQAYAARLRQHDKAILTAASNPKAPEPNAATTDVTDSTEVLPPSATPELTQEEKILAEQAKISGLVDTIHAIRGNKFATIKDVQDFIKAHDDLDAAKAQLKELYGDAWKENEFDAWLSDLLSPTNPDRAFAQAAEQSVTSAPNNKPNTAAAVVAPVAGGNHPPLAPGTTLGKMKVTATVPNASAANAYTVPEGLSEKDLTRLLRRINIEAWDARGDKVKHQELLEQSELIMAKYWGEDLAQAKAEGLTVNSYKPTLLDRALYRLDRYRELPKPERRKKEVTGLAAAALAIGLVGGLAAADLHSSGIDSRSRQVAAATAAPSRTTSPEVKPAAERLGAPVEVKRGDGYTQDISRYALGQGKEISPERSKTIYTALRARFGDDIIRGVDHYTMENGDLGLANTGTGNWAPGVQQVIDSMLS